jgi:homoserine kinase
VSPPPPAGVRVRVPASSANLGPGFDVLAAALSLRLELVVEPAPEFELRTELDVPRDRSNLLVSAFERLLPADALRFTVSSEIPLSGGLGSSAAAVVAGLLAARELTRGSDDVLALATRIEGHPDNVTAALLGGFVICAGSAPTRLGVPPGLAGVLVVPDTPVATQRARAALPRSVPLADAVFNVGAASLLTLGLARADFGLVAMGLGDRLHQPHRAHLYPRSAALLERGPQLGAIGSTISGAGPTVLTWCAAEHRDALTERLRAEARGWADVLPVGFCDQGAEVTAV